MTGKPVELISLGLALFTIVGWYIVLVVVPNC